MGSVSKKKYEKNLRKIQQLNETITIQVEEIKALKVQIAELTVKKDAMLTLEWKDLSTRMKYQECKMIFNTFEIKLMKWIVWLIL